MDSELNLDMDSAPEMLITSGMVCNVTAELAQPPVLDLDKDCAHEMLIALCSTQQPTHAWTLHSISTQIVPLRC